MALVLAIPGIAQTEEKEENYRLKIVLEQDG